MFITLLMLCFQLNAVTLKEAPDGTVVVRLKSSAELNQLDDDGRSAYLEAVRDSFREYESRMGKYLDEVSLNQRLPSPWSFVPEARAADAGAAGEFRCLYAGWSVRGARCRPQTSVEYKIRFTVKTLGHFPMMDDHIVMNLNCPARQTLCNPVVYGTTIPRTEDLGGPYAEKDIRPPNAALVSLVKARVKPVCVSAGDRRNVSRECYFKSLQMKAIPDPKYNPELWSQFKAGYDAMCSERGVTANPYFKNRERAAQDMKDTCAWTAARLDSSVPNARRRQSYGPDRDFNPADRRSNESDSAR